MIRSTLSARPVRGGFAAASVLGVVVLAGCAASDDVEPAASAPAPEPAQTQDTSTGDAGGTATGRYLDGTYTAEGSYATPESVETITVTVTLADDVVTSVDVVGDPQKRESEEYQAEFIGGIASIVEGKNIDELSVSRVAGSSLTSGGFNDAIATIKAEAAA